MARFRGVMQGCRGQASRLGTAKSGLTARVDGWDLGVRVSIGMDEDGQDRVSLYLTGGSNDRYPHKLIGSFKVEDLK